MDMKIIITIITALFFGLSAFPQVFSDDFTGIHSITINNVRVANLKAFYNDGDSVLYAVGTFNMVNGIYANGVFGWDTDTVRYFQAGIDTGGYAECIHKIGDTIYVGGGISYFLILLKATLSSGTVNRGRAVLTGNPEVMSGICACIRESSA